MSLVMVRKQREKYAGLANIIKVLVELYSVFEKILEYFKIDKGNPINI